MFALQNHPSGSPLPYANLSHLTNDQLFFVGYARGWCAHSLNFDGAHSADVYRVKGVLPNIPAFRNAFRCTEGDVYAPKDHCEVWISDVAHEKFMARLKNHND